MDTNYKNDEAGFWRYISKRPEVIDICKELFSTTQYRYHLTIPDCNVPVILTADLKTGDHILYHIGGSEFSEYFIKATALPKDIHPIDELAVGYLLYHLTNEVEEIIKYGESWQLSMIRMDNITSTVSTLMFKMDLFCIKNSPKIKHFGVMFVPDELLELDLENTTSQCVNDWYRKTMPLLLDPKKDWFTNCVTKL